MSDLQSRHIITVSRRDGTNYDGSYRYVFHFRVEVTESNNHAVVITDQLRAAFPAHAYKVETVYWEIVGRKTDY